MIIFAPTLSTTGGGWELRLLSLPLRDDSRSNKPAG
jgi:hypothetical protein